MDADVGLSLRLGLIVSEETFGAEPLFDWDENQDEKLLYSLNYCGKYKIQAVHQTGTRLVSVSQGLMIPVELIFALQFTDTL